MAKDKKTPLTIDGVDYNFEDLTPEQQQIVNHVADLDRKIAGSKFSLDQMQVGRDAFFAMLKTSLEIKPEE
jgi:hypothetical protein